MSFKLTQSLAVITAICLQQVLGHGWIRKVKHGDQIIDVDPFRKDTLAWYVDYDSDSNAFITGERYQSPDIVCHNKAENSPQHLTVAAGDNITFYWNSPKDGWGHAGPIIDGMARCDGKCETADKTSLKFFKLQQAGVLIDSNPHYPGHDFPPHRYWATQLLDDLNDENGSPWTVTIPPDLAAGNYIIRTELIGVHFAVTPNSAQNYPACFNLEVTGGGSLNPAGIPATEWYHSEDPGLHFDFLPQDTFGVNNYSYPGPPMYNGQTGSSLRLDRVPKISRLSQWVPVNGGSEDDKVSQELMRVAAAGSSGKSPSVSLASPANATTLAPSYATASASTSSTRSVARALMSTRFASVEYTSIPSRYYCSDHPQAIRGKGRGRGNM